MSLKAFHIVFVIVTVLAAFVCGVLLLRDYSQERQMGMLIGGLLSFVAGGLMIWYGKVVLRKLKHISYL